MQTSFFAKSGHLPNAVAISVGVPQSYTGKSCTKLMPPIELVKDFKAGHITAQEFEEVYTEQVLNKLDPVKVFEELKDSVLLCWEGRTSFCHRRTVARWLEKAMAIKVDEI